MSQYTDLLKKKGTNQLDLIHSKNSGTRKKQENRCAKCKRELRMGYYDFKKDPITGEKVAICSNCLIQIPKR